MKTNLTDNEVLELSALCHALVDGAITDPERARLERWLAESEDARHYYVLTMGLSASLCDYASEMQSEAPDALTKIVRPAAWRWAIGTLAAAAAVALAFWFGGMSERGHGTPVAEQESDDTVARLSGAKDGQWIGEAPRTGDELRRGQRVQLASGFAEITFDSGARVTVEGPASLDLTSAWEAVLHHGSLRAHVPTEAIGFRVSNPEVEVVDLGTEFSMVADASGGTEVYVLQGSVEVAAREGSAPGREPMVLREKQARRFAKSGASEVVDRDQKMDRWLRKVALDRLTRPASYVHWSFDETAGAVARAEATDGTRGSFDAQFTGSSPDAVRTSGRWNGALRCDGTMQATAALPSGGQRRGRTVAFWVQAAAEEQLPEAGPMLAWLLGGKDTRSVDLAWNRNPNHGPLGALRTRVGRGTFVGSTPVRDGRWHHVAVVFMPKQKPDGTQQIKHYIDGRLDILASKHGTKRQAGEVAETSAVREPALWIGQAVDGAGVKEDRFRGQFDELFIADRPLTPHEIRHLMTHNAPAPTEMLAAD